MLSFESDYILGAHEKVLEALIKTNNEVMSGYGNDIHTQNAKNLKKKRAIPPTPRSISSRAARRQIKL